MRIKLVIAATCCCLLYTGGAYAQIAPTQVRHNFETYSEALSFLLGAGDRFCGFVTSTPNGPNPALTILPGNVADLPPSKETGLIGPNLSLHCHPNTDNTNLSGGSVVGGSLSSLQSTRTVSQFETTRRRSEPCDPAEDPECNESDSRDAVISNYFYQRSITSSGELIFSLISDSDDALSASGLVPFDGFTMFGQIEYQNYRQSDSKFEPAKKIDIFTAEAGAFWDVGVDSVAGFKGLYSNGNGTSPRPETVTSLGTGNEIGGQVFNGNFENICGVPHEGTIDTSEFGGSVFYQTMFLQDGFINAELGVSKSRLKYGNSLCKFDLDFETVAENVFNIFPIDQTAGIIRGNPDILGLSADINAGYDWEYNSIVVGPRLSFSAKWKKVGSYSETEEPGTLNYPITGASLNYEDQDISSVQTRIGVAVSRPFTFNTMTVVPFAQFDYIHEFANDQRTIRATFVEDGRPDPFRFTFKTNPPDRDFFELRTGVIAEVFNGGVAYIDGRAILANELVDNYGLTGGLRISF
ncbi:autotransporter outer membrane beta-barrel domain-containing protein (plasmid) [Sinorhizobium sp. K101]|uniref:autotransporter outer membrane beta-barrel domain-containing protein n=1 Tax=Sinorhizobium sp. K101 TaxID=2976820 RepID=UPI0023D86BCE|nr:autotransporter outer membrane beta-barrel domain-containing protein [Sinorhizobium sp. K101]WEJ17614.1 autotransporter outer membrane beta-barrel domain-containing protein [Sinorhizobium sp. K101]